MAFTFNWAGVNVSPVSVRYDDITGAAGNFGTAARGSEIRDANRDYAEMLEADDRAATRIKEIDNELDFLKGRLSSLEYQRRISQSLPVAPGIPQDSPEGTGKNYPFQNFVQTDPGLEVI